MSVSDTPHEKVYTSKGISFSVCFFFKVFIEFVTILLLSYILVFRPQGMWALSSPTTDPWSKSLDSSPGALSPVIWIQPHLTQVWTHQAISKLEDCACSSSLSFVSCSSKFSQGHPPQEDFSGPPRLCPPTMGFHSTWADPIALTYPLQGSFCRRLSTTVVKRVNPGPQLPGCEP